MMLNTILFDLDGTLLPMDLKHFEKLYFGAMAEAFSDLTGPKELAENIWASTLAMVKNLEHRTNEEVFMEDFRKRIDVDLELYKERFDRFYDEGFFKTREAVAENELIQRSVSILKEKGYRVVIATNPLFPAKAVYHRVRWAGFEPSDFEYITHYENSSYCKPQVQYYKEILDKINKTAAECMMVGNDVQEDLVASEIGMKTFLIKDHIIHRTGDQIIADHIGEYGDFLKFVEGLPSIK
jgi:FMN phosphatase YigB (HAD superfamily)